jgi:hypothetical protein
MNATHVLSNVTEAIQGTSADCYYTLEILRKLAEECKQEIASKETRKVGEDRYKAVLSYAKKCAKEFSGNRSAMAGAFTLSNGKQYITNSYSGLRIEKPFEALPQADITKNEPLNLEACFPDSNGEYLPLPNLAELKADYKTAKAQFTGKAKDFYHLTALKTITGDIAKFDTSLLISMMECSGAKTHRELRHNRDFLYMSNDGIDAIICPVSPASEKWQEN